MRCDHTFAALRWAGAAALLLMTMLLPRASQAAPHDEVRWGLHEVTLENATMVVHSRWSVATTLDDTVQLAAALPATTVVTGADVQRAPDGSISALRLTDADMGLHTIETRISWDQARRTGHVPIAVPAGDSVHRVVMSPNLSFTPDPSMGLIAQVGHYAPADIDVVSRHRFDSRTDGDLRHVGAYYLRGNDLQAPGAMRGELELQRNKMGRAAIVAAGIFGLMVLAMLVIHRRLNRSVRHERAEAFLQSEFEALDDDDDDEPKTTGTMTPPSQPVTQTQPMTQTRPTAAIQPTTPTHTVTPLT